MYKHFSIGGVNALPRFNKNDSLEFSSEIVPFSNQAALYIHIPFCKTICQFCMLRRGAKSVNEIPDGFVNALCRELTFKKEDFKNVQINAIYFGGGTPSMLNCQQFEKLINTIHTNYSLSPVLEITFEGEANSLNNNELLVCLKRNNVNRISFGVQTFNESIRRLLGRTDELHEVYEVKEKLDALNFPEVNIDYLYNLPGTDQNFVATDLSTLKSFSPTSIDCHPLKYVSCSSYMLNEIVNKKLSIPNAKSRIGMFNYIREWCLENNYDEQFADQYSQKSLNTSNFYMQNLYGMNGGEYVGFGPGARSHYGDYGFSNIQNIDQYKHRISNGLNATEHVVYAPLCDNFITCFPKRNSTLSIDDVKKSSEQFFFLNKLNMLTETGYLEIEKNEFFILTSLGLQWYQNLQEELLSPKQREHHVQTIQQRQIKLQKFGEYFQDVGEALK